MTDKELLDCLTDRPCEVCRFHEEKGCTKWDCVFDEREPKTEPCKDCISRQAVDNLSRDLVHATRDKADFLCKFWEGLNALPPVTPQPKTGHWIYKNYNWHCSECDETPKTLGYVGNADFMKEHFKFCNHCGIKMSEIPTGSESEVIE